MNATRAWGWIVVGAAAIGCGGSGGSEPTPVGGSVAAGSPGPFQTGGTQNPFAPSGSGGPFAGASNPGPFAGGGSSGSAGSAGGGGAANVCSDGCATLTSAGCKDLTTAVCLALCAAATTDAQCGALGVALFQCAAGAHVSCGTNGKLVVKGCDDEGEAYDACSSPPTPDPGPGQGNGGG